ncbi:hypothetical protein [Dokdonella sp.]|uniref:hypothetical protein n=1 Tax=Dokdonella sp. TaxID=2291710 RepID=UPI002D80F432|nr:hypothetical protein [Dokdonella sp.]
MPTLAEQVRFIPSYLPEQGDMPTADFDGDGISDFAFSAVGSYSTIIQVVGHENVSGWSIKQAIILPTDDTFQGTTTIAAANTPAGAYLVAMRSYKLYVYTGWPLRLVRLLEAPNWSQFGSARIADVNNDGDFEIVVLLNTYPDTLEVYSLSSGAQLWSKQLSNNGARGLLIRQLDADPALEIVTGENAGTVIDGATHATEWQYKDGFGSAIVGGRFSATGSRFSGIGLRLTLFQSSPWSPLWDEPFSANFASSHDLDGDGIDEVLFPGQWGPSTGAVVFDMQTRSVRDVRGGMNAAAVAAGRFTASTTPSIALTSQSISSYPDALRVVSAGTGALEFSVPARSTAPFVTTLTRSGAGAELSLVSGANGNYGPDLPGLLYSIDATTGAFRWQTPQAQFGQPLYGARLVQLHSVSLPGMSDPAILFAAQSLWSGKSVNAIDSQNGQTLWSFPPTDVDGGFSNTNVQATLPLDRNGDGSVDSILVCTSETRLFEFRLSDHAQVWKSVAMPSAICNGLLHIDASGTREVVAVLPQSLRAYDLDTRLLSWTLPMVNAGASFITNGAAGREIAVFLGNVVHFIDPITRATLRTVTLADLDDIAALTQAEGADIHQLLVASGDRLRIVDGLSGAISSISEPLGYLPASRNQLPVAGIGPSTYAVGAGSGAGTFVYRMSTGADPIFANGFD